MVMAVNLAAPMIIALLLVDLVLGVISFDPPDQYFDDESLDENCHQFCGVSLAITQCPFVLRQTLARYGPLLAGVYRVLLNNRQPAGGERWQKKMAKPSYQCQAATGCPQTQGRVPKTQELAAAVSLLVFSFDPVFMAVFRRFFFALFFPKFGAAG